MDQTERLDKILSHQGFGTRKDVKHLLHKSDVRINGVQVFDPAAHLNPNSDTLTVDGGSVQLAHDLYLMMNKCADVVCANKDGEHQTVFDLIDDELRHPFLGGDLHTIGRLDIDTEGLLILTTDGEMTHRLISPKTHFSKTYAVRLRDKTDEKMRAGYAKKFADGIRIEADGNEAACDCQSAGLVWLSDSCAGQTSGTDAVTLQNSADCDCLLTICEGKFHQVKRMFAAVGNEVVYLKRVSMGTLLLDPLLKAGTYRELTADELERLK
jgi:16S rRNA pseudouridine516 synthase